MLLALFQNFSLLMQLSLSAAAYLCLTARSWHVSKIDDLQAQRRCVLGLLVFAVVWNRDASLVSKPPLPEEVV